MSVQITIIGLGHIGASIGLALSDRKETLLRVGNDIDPATARQAKKINAVDKVLFNLPRAVRDADLVVLAIPLDQVRETLSYIVEDLKENAVVLDMSPVKSIVLKWVDEMLPANRHYVGLNPLLNPAYLLENRRGIEAAEADLFRGGAMAIVTPPGVHSGALQMAVDLTGMLGASPLFADAMEVDSFMAATHILPHVLATALLSSTVNRPGWQDGRRFAGRAFTQATAPLALMEPPEALMDACLTNNQNVGRVIDGVIESLQTLKARIVEQEADSLAEDFKQATAERADWWRQRNLGEQEGVGAHRSEMPSVSETFSGMLFGSLGRKRGGKKD